MTSIRLERHEPARNRLRFYAITVTRTLFGSWTLIREWGWIGQAGTVRETWFETEAAASEAGMKVRQRKEKRGYLGRWADNRNCSNPICYETRSMVDTLTAAERSERMSRVRGKDTKPEMFVRRMVHGMGYRYRLHRRDLG